VGVNCEHSWADAPVMSQMWEAVVFNYDIVEDWQPRLSMVVWRGALMCQRPKLDSNIIIELLRSHSYRSNGHCRGQTRNNVPNPIRLQWDLNDACRSVIASQLRVATDLLNDVDLHLVVHRQFGKGAMKRCSMSPDAFIQLALQLAYFRDSGGEFCLTYEASMTRLFKEGRTETVRSCTNESCAFVRAMESGASNEEVVRLLRQASEKHQTMYRDAMTGKGVDRHLFTLYVVSKYCKTQSPFLEKALHCQWKLSTSQTPHGQTNVLDLEKHPDFLSAGGGFGPVSQDGYGVSYIIAGENTVFFHVSSRVSCDKTDSKRFGGTIVKALADLRTLLEEDKRSVMRNFSHDSIVTSLAVEAYSIAMALLYSVDTALLCTGSLANLINFCVFCAEPVRRHYLSALLRWLSLNDFTLLVVFCLVDWLNLQHLSAAACYGLYYVYSLATFLSAWLLVAITLDRFMILWNHGGVEVGQEVDAAFSNNSGGEAGGSSSGMKVGPQSVSPDGASGRGYGTGWSRAVKAKIVTYAVAAVGLTWNLQVNWSVSYGPHPGTNTTVVCMGERAGKLLFLLDSLVCSFVPGLLLIVINSYVACTISRFLTRQRKTCVARRAAEENWNGSNSPPGVGAVNEGVELQEVGPARRLSSLVGSTPPAQRQQYQVTRMLIGFSLGYLVCSFPNYIALLFGHFVLGRYAPEKSMMQFNLVRRCAQTLYIMHFSTNSLIYAYCNRQFGQHSSGCSRSCEPDVFSTRLY
uniref:G_PROTEIN_RECEP_F1_2 domain-containing protein n=1 Tax=Macrostomum lignano TaxID=282301 RepID=A0A1I8IWI5_9PLAT